MRSITKQRGDTIIEVVLGFAVFAAVIASAVLVMNRGTATAMRSLEITQVRQSIDSQAESLRFANAQYVNSFRKGIEQPTSTWSIIRNSLAVTTPSSIIGFNDASLEGKCPDNSQLKNAFVVDLTATEPEKTVATGVSAILANDEDVARVYGEQTGVTLPAFPTIQYATDSDITRDGGPQASNTTRAFGVWVQAVRGQQNESTGFIDFFIRSCWSGSGSSRPITLGTTVRLYEPI